MGQLIHSFACFEEKEASNFIVVILHDLPIEGAFFRPGKVVLDSIPVDP